MNFVQLYNVELIFGEFNSALLPNDEPQFILDIPSIIYFLPY